MRKLGKRARTNNSVILTAVAPPCRFTQDAICRHPSAANCKGYWSICRRTAEISVHAGTLARLRRDYLEPLQRKLTARIALDLDDGVKVNDGKFGDLLAEVKTVTGKSAD